MIEISYVENSKEVNVVLDEEYDEDAIEDIKAKHPDYWTRRLFTCQGRNRLTDWSCPSVETSERSDAYGNFTGHYCDDCYENNYPYRKDRYLDPSYAGERMDSDD